MTTVLISLFFIWTFLRKGIFHKSIDQESQAELDHYLSKNLDLSEIGLAYERQIGYLYETHNYYVKYNGAIEGVYDQGIDLIAVKNKEVLIIQTKCWANFKTINVKHILKLCGSLELYKKRSQYKEHHHRAILYTSAKLSEQASEAASILNIEIKTLKLDRTYPMIKCNISQSGEKIYHLPTDPFYDKISILGDDKHYVRTVSEAVSLGFRRARTPKNNTQKVS